MKGRGRHRPAGERVVGGREGVTGRGNVFFTHYITRSISSYILLHPLSLSISVSYSIHLSILLCSLSVSMFEVK